MAALLIACPVLIAASAPFTGRVAYLGEAEGYWQVFAMKPDGTEARQVTRSPGDKTRVSWYPRGDALLVSTQAGVLVRVDLETGREEALALPGTTGTLDAALSSDGRWVAFSVSPAEARDNHEIFVVGIDGKGLRKLTHRVGLQDQPSWSPDGRWIYFQTGTAGSPHLDILRMAPDGSGQEQLTAGQRFHFEVAVAPDGAIAFSSNRRGNYELYVQEESAGEPRRLTEHPGADGSPTWSADGRTLLFDSTRSGKPGIFRVAREGGEPVAVPTPGPARRPVWWAPPQAGAAR